MPDGEPLFEAFRGGGLHGEVSVEHRPTDVVGEVTRVVDPSASVKTIHWGRNFIYAAVFETAAGSIPVVVKQLRNQGWFKRLERKTRGSKAERSWRVAKEMVRVGLATPDPLLWVESDEPDGPSFFVARYLEDAVEVRQFFRRLNGEPGAVHFPEVDEFVFLHRLGRLAREINDAGILYRDLSMGNILVEEGESDLRLSLIDFNRARIGRHPGVYQRTRDICRLPVLRREHRAAFLEGYWGQTPARWSFRWWFYGLSVDGYTIPTFRPLPRAPTRATGRCGIIFRTSPISTRLAARSWRSASQTVRPTCATLRSLPRRRRGSGGGMASSRMSCTRRRFPSKELGSRSVHGR